MYHQINVLGRNPAISLIRVLVMFSILGYHFFQYYGKLTWLNTGVYVFLCMSGFLYGSKDIDDWISFYHRNFLKILIDMYLVLIPFIIIALFDADYPLTGRKIIEQVFLINMKSIGGVAHLWFITYILGCYFLTPFLLRNRANFKQKELFFQPNCCDDNCCNNRN